MFEGACSVTVNDMEPIEKTTAEQLNMDKRHRQGLAAAIGCMMLWGVLPGYWKALVPISSGTIIIYRILLVFVSALLLARRSYTFSEIFAPFFHDRKMAVKSILAGAVVTLNWSTYIWAVNAGHIVDCSIGYYIEPLMVCLFGIVLFREKLTGYKGIALFLATVSVIILLVHFHKLPFIPLGLAISFSIYSAIKKTVTLPPLISLVYETILYAPFALGVIIWLEVTGKGALSQGQPYQFGLLLLCGLLTAIPLGLFSSAAQKVTMFELGLVEYISPTLSMLMGLFIYHEAIDGVELIAVAIIWVGLVFFSVGEYRTGKKTGEVI